MSFLTAIALSLVVLLPSPGAEDSSRLHFPELGFSIDPVGGPWRVATEQPLMLAMLPMDGFAPNVGVIVQPFAGALEQYAGLTRNQLKAVGFDLLSERIDEGNMLVVEYAGSMEGRDLRWYATAFQRGNRIYLVTATAPAGHWESLEQDLTATVHSFRLEVVE